MQDVNFDAQTLLSVGQTVDYDHEYCFNEVVVSFVSTTGQFVNPEVEVAGGYNGADFRDRTVNYSGSGRFTGAPTAAPTTAAAGTSTTAACPSAW